MRELRLDEFKGREGEDFALVHNGETVTFNLAAVRPMPDSGREGGAFVLDWKGPYEPVLPQDIYTFRHGEEEFEMFIVAVGRKGAQTQYEAVFN
jgi:hypothetical protein